MQKKLKAFEEYLIQEEKSQATVEKYLRDVRCFLQFSQEQLQDKRCCIAYKEYLTEHYAPASVNSMLVSLNCFLKFIGRAECCVRLLRLQKQLFEKEEKILSKEEYYRLLAAAKKPRLKLALESICATGIRVSELRHITVESVHTGRAVVNCKGKMRTVFLPTALKKKLVAYIKRTGITAGSVFVTKSGRPLCCSNLWREMKALCKTAQVDPGKVFPHNLRHLFARTFYAVQKDIVRLADLLGHSSVNTTRIYTAESGVECLTKLKTVQQLLIT